MRRRPAYDPPEYVDWTPEPGLVEAYRRRLDDDPERRELVAALDDDALLGIYAALLRTRLHDIVLKRWVRRGIIAKAWLGTGEEAVTVGAVRALDRERDVVAPMIRNAGACHEMGMPLAAMLRGYLATADAPGGGRDLHIGDLSRGILRPISHMGTMVPVIAGVALSFRTRGEGRVALTWIGDGATKTAECHEGLNLAAVRRTPAVFVLQNNQVALGTRAEEHGAGSLEAWPRMYGIPGWECDGNNVLDVYAATRLAAERCREGGGPAMVVAETFRMGGHATHDEREARETFPDALFAEWGRRDPIGMYEAYLEGRGIPGERLRDVEDSVDEEVERAARDALDSRSRPPAREDALYQGISRGSVLEPLADRPLSREPRSPEDGTDT